VTSRSLAALLLGAAVVGGCSGGAGSDGRAASGGPADRHGDDAALVATAADRGSFSTPCEYSHSRPDDPIVHAGHAGVSHRHDFFGATGTDAASDAESLLAGDTTCRSVADRSAYWAPSLLAVGLPVEPTEVLAYYRVPVGADATLVEVPPNGLEMIAGDPAATSPQPAQVVAWRCGFTPEISPVPLRCPAGMDLRLTLTFDPCWNGSDLGSADHRSHLAPLGDDGACPVTHPVLLPELTLEIRYLLTGSADRSRPLVLGGYAAESNAAVSPALGAFGAGPLGPRPRLTAEPLDGTSGDLALASGPVTGGHGDALLAWDQEHITGEVEACLRANHTCDVVSEGSRLGFDQLD
jgi:hypothetical protein